MNEEAARAFVHKGNYLSIASRTLMKDRAELLNVFQSEEAARIQQLAEEKAEAARIALMKATERNTSKFANIDPTDIPMLQVPGMSADEVRRSMEEYQQQMVSGTGGKVPANIRRDVVSLENTSDVIIGSAKIADMTVTTIHLNKGYNPPPVVESKPVPTDFALEQNYPNPFNPSTSIGYLLPVESHVTIKVYDLLGREVATLLNLTQPSGRYLTEWSAIDDFGNEVSSGIYIYRIEAQPVDGSTAPFVASQKMVLSR
ncbi:MAG: T9SS type A sorting domain-containing protein [Chlorobi bacterium]|nr:T9SS type A sorting domain-containing protein [Chlorobiota bacterium]